MFFPHPGEAREAPAAGEVFRQPDLAATLRKLVEAEQQALAAGKSRKEALQAAYDRFYRGDVADELVRGTREQGGLFTKEDLARWKVKIEEPVRTSYRGIDVYKLDVWTQGPAMLQALNILENADLRAMGYNSPQYVHTVYQAMSLAFADRDFYYGDPDFPPEEPVAGLLSKEYAKQRFAQMRQDRNDPDVRPGRPVPVPGRHEPVQGAARRSGTPCPASARARRRRTARSAMSYDEAFRAGTTSVVAADAEGWVVSMTPSGGWVPGGGRRAHRHRPQPAHAELRARPGREPVQRARARQAAARHAHADAVAEGRPAPPRLRGAGRRHAGPEPAAVLPERRRVRDDACSRRPRRRTSTATRCAARSAQHESRPGPDHGGRVDARSRCAGQLEAMGYTLEFEPITSGPINAILFDRAHGTMWGGSSHHGEDYGIGW